MQTRASTGRARRLFQVVVCVIAPACASSGQFPTVAELGELAARPAGNRIAPEDAADVDRWQLAGPLPTGVDTVAHAPASGWDGLLAEAVAARAGLVFAAESTACAARELGLFYVANRALPGEVLQQFISARCGVAGARVSSGLRWGDVADDVTEDRLLREWGPDVGADLRKTFEANGGPALAGIWFGRKGGRAVVLWAVAARKVQIDPVPFVPAEAGHVTIRGELLIAAEHLQGIANAGRFGVHRCVANPQVQLPRFALQCDVDAGDRAAWIDVAAFPPGRILGPVVLTTMVWPAGTPGDVFERPRTGSTDAGVEPGGLACASSAGGDVSQALAACINRVRAEARLAPLDLAPAESRLAERLAPHFFAAMIGAEPELVADKVVLGLRAGWDVGAALRYGQFASGVVLGSADVEHLVAAVLDRPSGREALLDPEARRLAIGAVGGGSGKALGAIFGAYSLFDGRDDPGDPARVWKRLTDLRARKGRAAPGRMSAIEADVATATRRIAAEAHAPDQALQEALEAASARVHSEVRGWWIEATKLDEMDIPADLIQASSPNIAIAVSHYRRADEPWTHYVVVIVSVAPKETLALR
jgi:hypothetical protein